MGQGHKWTIEADKRGYKKCYRSASWKVNINHKGFYKESTEIVKINTQKN